MAWSSQHKTELSRHMKHGYFLTADQSDARGCAYLADQLRVKSGMLSASVAQNPTLAVSAGKKVARNCPSFGIPTANWDGAASIGPNPPEEPITSTRSPIESTHES
eukprot:675869-Prorocentrum_minimum.AAC.2